MFSCSRSLGDASLFCLIACFMSFCGREHQVLTIFVQVLCKLQVFLLEEGIELACIFLLFKRLRRMLSLCAPPCKAPLPKFQKQTGFFFPSSTLKFISWLLVTLCIPTQCSFILKNTNSYFDKFLF